MINKTYLHPIGTCDYFKSVSSCHVLTCPYSSNKNSPHSKLKQPSHIFFCNYPSQVLEFSIPPPTVLKLFKLSSTGDKKTI